MYYMRPNIQRNPHPKPCLLDQAHVIGNCLYRPWMTMKQWREIIIGRPRALCFICSVFVHIKPCGATTPTCNLLPAGTGIACSTAIASTSSPSLCWWRHSFLPWPAAGARRIAWCGRTLGMESPCFCSSKNVGFLLIYGVHHFLQPEDPGKPMETWVFSPPCSRVAWSLLLLGPGDAHQSRDLPHAAPRTAYDHFLCH